MKSRSLLYAALLFRIALPASSHAALVIGITDGDTLTILENNQPIKVRLANIDAPEKKQPFGQQARQSLSDLCFGKDAQVRPQNKDRYGRTVAIVVCEGIEANREQVVRGMAWTYSKYNKDAGLPAIEASAQAKHTGLWADKEQVPPWEWRHRKHR